MRKLGATLLLGVGLLFATPNISEAAIAFDSAVRKDGSGTSFSQSVTVTGANPILWVGLYLDSGTDKSPDVQYGGVAMTRTDFKTDGAGNGVYLFYITGAIAGTANVTGSWSGSNNYSDVNSSYTGVDQASPIDAHTTSSAASGTSQTDTITVVTTGSWILDMVSADGGGLAPGSGTTQRTVSTAKSIGDSNGAPGTGPQSLNWTMNSGAWATCIAAFKPAAATPTTKSQISDIVFFN